MSLSLSLCQIKTHDNLPDFIGEEKEEEEKKAGGGGGGGGEKKIYGGRERRG